MTCQWVQWCDRRLTTDNKIKVKIYFGKYLTKKGLLGINMKTTYFSSMKNLFKSYIISVLRSMINVHM